MKTVIVVLLANGLFLFGVQGAPTDNPSPTDPLVAKYDLNGNGKIDANEHREYARALSRQRQAEAKMLAVQTSKLSADERKFFVPPQITPEVLKQYDTNQDGRLEPEEYAPLVADTTAAAKKEFQQYDANGDGKLDKEELKAAEPALKQKRQAARGSIPENHNFPKTDSTNSPPPVASPAKTPSSK
jgi:Ca2+-binding EF-hand superfamily protein